MTTAINTTLESQTPVHKAIRAAAEATGIGFDYLMTTAERESNLNPSAKAKSSSASGLFQFVDSTWLTTMKQHGAELGYAQEAQAIRANGNGTFSIDDPAMRQHIMALRFDPEANAMMAGAFTQQNSSILETRLDREPTQGELYIAHFLGAEGAGKFISQAQNTPGAPAAAMFPKAAGANPSIFYARGRMRSMSEVYASLVSQHQNASLETQKIASLETAQPQAHNLVIPATAKNDGQIFRNLFTPTRSQGLSPVVTALWTRHEPETAVMAQQAAPARQGFFPMTRKPEASAAPVSEGNAVTPVSQPLETVSSSNS